MPPFDDSAFLCMVPRYTNPGLSSLVESMELTLPGSHESFAAKKMSPWLLQPGMPLVTVGIEARSDAGDAGAAGVEIVVSQRPSAAKLDQRQLWWVPLSVYCFPGDRTVHTVLDVELETRAMRFGAPTECKADSFLFANWNSTAFIITNYTNPKMYVPQNARFLLFWPVSFRLSSPTLLAP